MSKLAYHFIVDMSDYTNFSKGIGTAGTTKVFFTSAIFFPHYVHIVH